MADVAIRLEQLSKRYTIGERREPYKTLRDIVADRFKSPFSRARKAIRQTAAGRADDKTLWALKDVSLEVKRGEVVGVIGRNGAGKSTLLKILSRITQPTAGYAEIRGRVGSLLEVGTGFHHELTGRENIYLSGAILGMKRKEINKKFDEIVDFAEVSRFIDTPVKHYSSGMHLRLAFSVAAHLEPEILLVDEVLAVGDIAFQRKCLGKMDDVASQGRTVLFVSHNLGIIKELCQTSIFLSGGQVEFRGSIVEGLTLYSNHITDDTDPAAAGGLGWRGIRINGQPNGIATSLTAGEPLAIESGLEVNRDVESGHFFLIVNDSIGNVVLHERIKSDDLHYQPANGSYHLRVDLPPLWLAPAVYTLYFKFIGRCSSGAEERHLSERAILDVTGSVNSIGRAYLAPPVNWTCTAAAGFKSPEV